MNQLTQQKVMLDNEVLQVWVTNYLYLFPTILY